MPQALPHREFNDMLVESIDETITTLLSREVVDALYGHLLTTHSISKDEVPFRLETLLSTLERTFGFPSSKTIGKVIAKKFYAKLDLPFSVNPGGSLLEYIEEAKIRLGRGEGQQ